MNQIAHLARLAQKSAKFQWKRLEAEAESALRASGYAGNSREQGARLYERYLQLSREAAEMKGHFLELLAVTKRGKRK